MYSVFIVDDEEIIVTGLSRMLPWAQYNCAVAGTASDGEAALAAIRDIGPDILFTDIRMPGMDGLSLIAALCSEFPDMQIAILSGYPDFEYAQKAISLGVSHYILKPSRMDELEAALAKMTRTLDTRNSAPQDAADGPDNAGNFIINNALRYIEAHYAEKLTLSEVADRIYVSQWHLSKLIAKVTGQSFSDLLGGARIRQAKKLLANPALKIWEVSERVGFADVSHFSRIFKKIEGQSANKYRAQIGVSTTVSQERTDPEPDDDLQ